ncbi:hypothetical protein P4U97_19065 [Bacillus swezeyi]|uniref:hypothetical protein n=1 Tax=Bacillus swezeyi TaxID=1925020 RepID=UPI002E1BCBF8|nr:hypothetical protein [Bacillus swezeyi]
MSVIYVHAPITSFKPEPNSIIRNTLRPKFKVDDIQKEMNSVYSSLLYSFEGKAQQALAQRISQSAQQLIKMEQDGENFVNGFKTR